MPALAVAVMAMGESQRRESIIRLRGEYDLARKDEVAAQFKMLDSEPVRIDFSEVTYIDSTVLRELAQLRLRDEERSITLTGVNSHIRHLFTVVNFDRLFEITE